MRVIGFDPSLTHAGVAVGQLDASFNLVDIIHIETVITAKSKDKKIKRADDDFNRVMKISLRFDEIIDEYKPEWGFCELPYGAQSARAGFAFGIVYGMMGSLPIPMANVSPRDVKMVTGDKHADKEDMVRWAVENYPHLDWPASTRSNDWEIMHGDLYVKKNSEHMADACGVLKAGVDTKLFET